jgi:flagellar basal-body rod modification protein FlgD
MATDSVVVSSNVGLDGNSYTTSISNDKLTNDDFLKLLLEEMKMQDPTEPMDSDKLLDSQLQMSQIEANNDMSKAMQELSYSYKVSNLSTSANMINHVVEDGQLNDEGMASSYQVASVKQQDGEVVLLANKITAYDSETNEYTLESEFTEIPLLNVTKIY